MTTLRVIVDDVIAASSREAADAAQHLTRSLIETAPSGAVVEGVISASPEDDYASIRHALPGLSGLYKSPLARRELRQAWRAGALGLPGGGMVHAPSLFAPLYRHDRLSRPGQQLVVTIPDALPWTHPEALPSSSVSWTRAMAKRAERFADAVVVPSHSVAGALGDALDLGGRIRVIPGAPRLFPTRTHPIDLDVPARFVLTVLRRGGDADQAELAAATARIGVPLHVIVPRGLARPEPAEGLVVWADPDADEQRALLASASVYVDPSGIDGGGGWLLESFAAGTPAIHADVADLVELSSEASLQIAGTGRARTEEFESAIEGVLGDPALAERLRVSGLDRARAFSWRDAAEKVWQLHADL